MLLVLVLVRSSSPLRNCRRVLTPITITTASSIPARVLLFPEEEQEEEERT